MNEFRLALVLSDEALASALARAIAKEYRYVLVHIGEWDEADYTIRDGFLGGPAPVWEISPQARGWAARCRKTFPRQALEVLDRTQTLIGRNVNLKILFTDMTDRLFLLI